jgi:glyoxylase-like metal-dependent hydrolase (beta-lactamase superfamily II)
MTQPLSFRTRGLAVLGVAIAVASPLQPIPAQTNPYGDSLLPTVRSLARAVPGDLPTTIGYLSVQDDSSLVSDAVEGAPHTRVFQVTPVFQVRYPKGWIMVDAAYDRQAAGTQGRFFQDRYDRVLTALRGARLIVVTHEHGDHVGTLLRPAVARDVAGKTILTRQQVQTLSDKSSTPGSSLDPSSARRFLIVDYERVLPIAPGVVLIRAPGHTPGSQMVYVKLASGREIVLAGDVAWHMSGVDMQHQKPDSVSRQMHEDRTAVGQELAWLGHNVAPAAVTIAISHDGTELQALSKRGILSEGLDLTAP